MGPPHGNSREEMGGARSMKSSESDRLEAIVLTGIEQSTESGSIRSKALLMGHGERKVTESTKLADPCITLPYHGTLRKECSAGLWQTDDKEMFRSERDTTSFWEKTLPREDWMIEPTGNKSGFRSDSTSEVEWARSQENIDLGTPESDTLHKPEPGGGTLFD
jgi:hypothetical protein